jgi:UDP-N-acetylmuramoyl-L-alanyl-D-glutamate--2,6-diaminopimelate ligase
VQNAALAAGLAIATGAEPGANIRGAGTPHRRQTGRLELVGDRNGAPVFIDYAHKPDALKKALASLRPYAKGKLTVVFGAGGDRDTCASGRSWAASPSEGADRSSSPTTIRAARIPAANRAAILADAPEAHRSRRSRRRDPLSNRGSQERRRPARSPAKGHETGQIVG